ncbi:MAG: Sulfate transporter [Candidatus Peregrinibacteria bacterium GW2011_GWA2_33_10]|nr:MAG: Sulfate transporter [Candidatus Peregrinibacteria bacterium GW2011_GWA2_33_10]KKP39533.1 MAG: sulfate transporter sulfate permease, SulP family [Candidatus Peregrinibacteria bacterium GW2011_GWC2_33_13]OGJ46661.1 MAG: hypothetical protein A2229_04575 [Candidatus Peregrinibacteria bacterium RIFOXYA2_FULL_33_7]
MKLNFYDFIWKKFFKVEMINLFKKKIGAYFNSNFKSDLIAGIIVALIALPLAIAFAVASGARPEQGVYTSIIAGIVIGVLSGSNYQVSGPTGAFIVILLGIVNKFGLEGLMMAGFMAGVILILMGVFQVGSVIKYIPYPVTIGFTAGIGVIIFTGQIKDFFGLQFPHRPHDFIENIKEIFQAFPESINVGSFFVALFTLIVFILCRNFAKHVPAPPVALLAGTILSLFIHRFSGNLISAPTLLGEIPAGLPEFKMLSFSFENMRLLLPSAFTIAALGAIESLLSAVVADGMTGTKHNSNKELIAQGAGNLILPFFGAIPATGAIARTAANIKNGAKTRGAAIIHGIVLIFILLVAAPYAKFIPLAALSAILMTVAYYMSEIPHFTHLLKSPRYDVAVLLTTFFLTILVDLTFAVAIGMILASVLFIKTVSKLSVNKILEDSDVPTEGSQKLHESVRNLEKITLYEVAGPLFFGIASELENLIEHQNAEILILRMKHVHHIDASAIHNLEIIIDRVHKNHGKVYLATLNPSVRKALEKQKIIQKLGGDLYTPNSTTLAIEYAKKEQRKR